MGIRSALKTGCQFVFSEDGPAAKAFPTGEGGPRSGPDEVLSGACKAPGHDYRITDRQTPEGQRESFKESGKI